jgi:amidase
MATRRELMAGAGGAITATLFSACAKKTGSAAYGFGDMDGVETAARIKAQDFTAAEALEAAIARAEKVEGDINAIAFKTYSSAQAASQKPLTGPFAGVPTFIKDAEEVAGERTGFGSRAFPGYKSTTQSPFIDSVFGLGVVSLGKSALPEFGLTATTESTAKGATRNPWNLEHSTGGSSGGAAALVAARVTPFAHGSDGGGSIRIPAACCGLVGLKSSRGRYAQGRKEAGPFEIIVGGALTRTVRDTAAICAALEASSVASLPPVGVVAGPASRRLRIGLALRGINEQPIDKDVETATLGVAARLRELGHEVIDIAFPATAQLRDDFTLYWAHAAARALEFWEKSTGLSRNGLAFEKLTLGLGKHFEDNAGKFDDAVKRLVASGDQYAALFERIDATLTPVVATPPPPIGYFGPKLDYDEHMARLQHYVAFTSLWNVNGAPSISLPLSMSSDGLPIGAMFGARMSDERTLLELSYELEEAMPWKDRKPAVTA